VSVSDRIAALLNQCPVDEMPDVVEMVLQDATEDVVLEAPKKTHPTLLDGYSGAAKGDDE